MYNHYGKCIVCKYGTCLDELYTGDGVCWKCHRKMMKKRKCRTCCIVFSSGNKLFKHLDVNPTHKKQ